MRLRDTPGSVQRQQTDGRLGFYRSEHPPFRPFVLANTSIGQEGLDFHPDCHVVYHWNLPSNPVDMEQREGRVHRYKGHAVRKNLAAKYGLEGVRRAMNGVSRAPDGVRRAMYGPGDPWAALFELAREERPSGSNDLIPYWLFPIEGGAKVEWRVLCLPFSREESVLPLLQRSLAMYRLVFGQPRQEDLLEYILTALEEEAREEFLAAGRSNGITSTRRRSLLTFTDTASRNRRSRRSSAGLRRIGPEERNRVLRLGRRASADTSG